MRSTSIAATKGRVRYGRDDIAPASSIRQRTSSPAIAISSATRVRAAMVSSPGAYRWSSFEGNSGRVANKLLTPHVEYAALGAEEGSRQRAYAQMLNAADDPGFLTAIRDATDGGLALVDAGLKAKLEAQSGRRLEHKKSGPTPAPERPALDTLSLELGF